jgi:hypothetical protein
MPKKDTTGLDPDDDLRAVVMPSGSAFYCHEREVQYFNDRCRKYLKDNHFTNISDLQDLDRLIITELLVWRWELWVSQDRDYWREPIDQVALARQIKDHSAEIRQLKKALGIDKETRDRQRGEDSVDAYLNALRERAKEFGYMRDTQHAKAIETMQQIIAVIGLHQNCDEQEQREQKCTQQDIFTWLIEEVIPEFNAIDEEFRSTSQKMWIQKQ